LKNRFFFHISLVVYGFVSLAAQLLFLRELGVLFYGNELFLGYSLGAWLLWAGLGSFLFQKIPEKIKALVRAEKASFFPVLFLALGLLIPLTILLIRLSRLLFGFGMTAGPASMMLITGLLLLPVGMTAGAVFCAGTVFFKERLSLPPSQVYFLESAGAIACGIIYTFCAAGRLSNFTLAIILSTLVLLVNVPFAGIFRKKTAFLSAVSFSFFLLILMIGLNADRLSHAMQWKGYELLRVRDSRFGNLVLTKTGGLMELFQDGLITSHFPDPQSHEEIVHLALLAHPAPKKILIVGNALTGELKEILKHPVRVVDHTEIDPALEPFLSSFLSADDRTALTDPRVKISREDGRAYLKRASEIYDVIILNLPEPANAQINRYYTQEFFREAKRRLSQKGIFVLRIPSSENYLPPQITFFNRSLYQTLKTVFQEVALAPEQSLLLLASQKPVELNPQILAMRYLERNLKNIQVVPSYFPVKLDSNRIAFLKTRLTEGPLPALNRDFSPVSYLYLWQTWLLKFQSPSNFLWLLAAGFFIFVALRILFKKRARLSFAPEMLAIFSLGFSGIVYEILLLLVFEALLGYVYWQIGMLFAAFMTGLALGSFLGRKTSDFHAPNGEKSFEFLCFGQAGYGILLSACVLILARGQGESLSFAGIAILLNLLMFPAGLLPGYGFSLLSRFAPAGNLYAADLWGGALGAILTGLFLVPLFGLITLFWMLSAALILSGILIKMRPLKP